MIQWITIIFLGITPLLFLPVTQDFYDTSKLMVLAVSACLVCLLVGIKHLIHKRRPVFSISLPAIGFTMLTLASFASVLISSTNKTDALMSPLGFVGLLSLTLLMYSLSNASHELKTRLLWTLVGSTTIAGLIALYQFVGMGRVMAPGIAFLQDSLWTPTGSTTTTLALFAVALTVLLPSIRNAIRKHHSENTIIFSISSFLIITAGFVVTLIQFIPKATSSLMPISAAWSVATTVLTHVKSALVGVGAENFVSAYTTGKPASMIATNLWNVRFMINANFFFHLTTVYGLIGLAASIGFLLVFIRLLKNASMRWALIVYIVCLFLIPPSLTLLTIGAVLLVLANEKSYSIAIHPSWIRFVLGALLILMSIAGLYLISRAYIGELRYFAALSAVQENKGTPAYNWHGAAIRTNPNVMRYHVTFSQVSLSLANSVATTIISDATVSAIPNSQNQQVVGELIQQAIREAKTAVTLSPQSIVAWENLGATYQALMQIAQGSDAWAAASYQKALSLDPTNPVLLVNLGSALTHEKKYDEAIEAYMRALRLKSDYASAYYNMAQAYKLKGDAVRQIEALTQALSLVAPGSSDYVSIQNELYVARSTTP